MAQTQTIKWDSEELRRVLSAVENKATGLGGRSDKTTNIQINSTPRLSKRHCDELYKIGMLTNFIDDYPISCARDWMRIEQVKVENQIEDFNPQSILKYLQDLRFKEGKIGIIEAFKEATIAARKYGDGYILMGIADGQDSSQPVNENNIQSIEWLKVFEQDELVPQIEGRYRDNKPEYYNAYGQSEVDLVWHRSRVLFFTGHKLSGSALQHEGYRSLSSLQKIVSSWMAWNQGNQAGSCMLADYNQGVHKMKSLAQAVRDDKRSGNNNNQQAIQARLNLISYSRSVNNDVLIDMDEEDFEYVTRRYQGARDIMDGLEEALAANSDLPDYRLFNKNNRTGALSTQQTAGLAQRYDWNQLKNQWMSDNWIEEYEKIVRYTIAANDSPVNQNVEVMAIPNAKVELTPLEKIQLQNEAADRDEKNINIGVYGPKSAQSQFLSNEYDGMITIDPDEVIEVVEEG